MSISFVLVVQVVHDISKFGNVDIIVGDSNGQVVLFSNDQIISRVTFSIYGKCLHCMCVRV